MSSDEAIAVSGTPTWFGPKERPLFGWVHLPAQGRARGVAVFCNPIGREAANALPAVRSACDEVASTGIVALRFDYGGTGDSAGGLDDPGQVDDWVDSVGHAVAMARTISPGPVVLVGMRVGALVATEAVSQGTAVDRLVLWDPVSSGRSFLRKEQTLLATGYAAPQPDDGSVAGPAFVYAPETVRDLSPLALRPPGPSGPGTVVLGRAGDRAIERARADFEEAGADWIHVHGQAELLDVFPDLLTVPTTTIKTLAERIDHLITGADEPADFVPRESAVISHDGAVMAERSVRLGPNALFAMVTEPAPDPAADPAEAAQRPTLVFLSAGALDHIGPGRRWVELTRSFAAAGIRSVRVDVDGLGESDGRPDQPRNVPKPASAIEDVCDIIAALGDPDARGIVLVGLSSGGYHAIEAALRLHPLAVCAMNPGLATPVYEVIQGESIDPRRMAYRPKPAILRKLSVRHARLSRWLNRGLLQVAVWRSPHRSVAGVGRRGIPMLLVLTEEDSHQFEPSPFWQLVRGRLTRRGLLEVRVVPGFDHSTYTVAGREHTYPLLTEWITERFAPRRRPAEATPLR